MYSLWDFREREWEVSITPIDSGRGIRFVAAHEQARVVGKFSSAGACSVSAARAADTRLSSRGDFVFEYDALTRIGFFSKGARTHTELEEKKLVVKTQELREVFENPNFSKIVFLLKLRGLLNTGGVYIIPTPPPPAQGNYPAIP